MIICRRCRLYPRYVGEEESLLSGSCFTNGMYQHDFGECNVSYHDHSRRDKDKK